jgi:hypothetical protein
METGEAVNFNPQLDGIRFLRRRCQRGKGDQDYGRDRGHDGKTSRKHPRL